MINKQLLQTNYLGISDEAFMIATFLEKYDDEDQVEDEIDSNTTTSTATGISKKKKKGRKKDNKDLNL